MPQVFVATNTFAGFDFENQLVDSNAGATHDAANGLDRSLGIQATSGFLRYNLDSPEVETWFSFRIKGNGIVSAYDTPLFETIAADGTPMTRLSSSNGTVQFQRFDGSAWVNVGASISGFMPAVHRFDLHSVIDPVNGAFELYIDGSLHTAFFGNTTGAATGTTSFKIAGPNPFGVTGYRGIIITDTVDTRTILDLKSNLPNGAGFYDAWNGVFTDVNSVGQNDVIGIDTDTADEISSFTLDDPNIVGNSQIAGVVLNARAQRTATGPQALNLGVRTGGADFFSPDLALSEIAGNVSHTFGINPATNAPWTQAEIVTMELAIRSRT